MTDSDPSLEHFYPNKLGRIVLMAIEEIVGHNGLNALLNLANLPHLVNNLPASNYDLGFPYEDISALQKALEDMYGPRGGRGLALRAGRACFKYGMREFGPSLGLSDLTYRLLPLNMKLKVGADVFARTFTRLTHQVIRLEEEPDAYLWVIERCPICWGRTSEVPCCHLAVGILQESLFWVSGGKNFLVDEITCIAKGDPTCTIRVLRQPLD
jgi:predicted hydrocarbon binding protein